MHGRGRRSGRGEVFDVLGVPVSTVTFDDAVATIETHVAKGARVHVCVCSVNMVLTARKDPVLRHALDTAAMVTPDGYPLTRLGQRRGSRPVGRVRGTDLLRESCARLEGRSHFFYGGAEGVPERVADALHEATPGLQVAGTHSPPFRALTPDEDAAIVEEINAARPDIVWVGLGCPKQEHWMVEHRDRLDAPVLVGVGAAFDFVAGTKREAPRAVQRMGLEWAWRFSGEPRRLWRRVLVEGPQFVGLLAAERISRGRRDVAEGGA